MSDAARKLLQEVLNLPPDERLALASEIIASVDGPDDAGWEAAWLGELDWRVGAATSRGESGRDWTDARSRILKRLGRTASRLAMVSGQLAGTYAHARPNEQSQRHR